MRLTILVFLEIKDCHLDFSVKKLLTAEIIIENTNQQKTKVLYGKVKKNKSPGASVLEDNLNFYHIVSRTHSYERFVGGL